MERRKNPRITSNGSIRIGVPGADQARRELEVRVLNESDEGVAVVTPVFLAPGSSVTLGNGPLSGSGMTAPKAAKVQWCTTDSSGGFRAGLQFTTGGSSSAAQPDGDGRAEDFYDVLQVSPKAHPDTIHRVFRILAQRYHPDNPDTGDAQTFHYLMTAYQVLSDPEKRAAYDVQRTGTRDLRWKIFDTPSATVGVEAEKRKRAGVLTLLYTKRVNQPHEPSMAIREIEELLGCPKEHLEFCFWYLKERAWVVRADNGRLSITANGVEQAELAAPAGEGALPAHRQLPGPGWKS